MAPLQALIVGCGVAGPAMALFLQQIGASPRVFEARAKEEGSIMGGGLQVAPNGMRVLGAAGVAEQIMSKGARLNRMAFRNQDGKDLGGCSNGTPGKFDFPAVTTTRNFLQDVLVEEALRHGVPIEYQKQLTKVVEEDGVVTASFADGTSATGDILIAADGIGSAVRGIVFPEAPVPEFSRMLGVGGFIRLEDMSHNDTMQITFGRFGQFGLCGAGSDPHEFMWWSRLAAEERPTKAQLLSLTTEDLRKQLLERYQGWHSPVSRVFESSKEILASPISFLPPLKTWHKGRVVLLGDAAHAMTPNAGQGASVALEDTIVLAKCLRDFPSIEEAFNDFERQRMPRAYEISSQARRNTEMLHELSPWKAWLRDTFVSWFFYLSGEKMLNKKFDYCVDL